MPDGGADAEDPVGYRHATPIRTGTSSRQCESGGRWDTVDSGPDGYDGGLGIYRGTWKAFGGTEFAPNAGPRHPRAADHRGQRIYKQLGWDPWGCANNVLHWPQWSM